MHVAFVPNSGFVRSEPGYPIKVDAVFEHGADYIKADPDSKHARLEVQSLLKDKSGASLRFNYVGTVETEGPNGKVLRGEADAKTTEFGGACKSSLSPRLPPLGTSQNRKECAVGE